MTRERRIDDPAAMEKQARRRRAKERDLEAEQRKIKAERAQVLHSFLHRYRSAGLMVVEGTSEETVSKFREGFEIELGKRLLLLPADGNIQGEEKGEEFAETTLGAISAHRDTYGQIGVFGFEGVDFSGQSGRGTPQVAEHVAELLAAARAGNQEEPAVVAIGEGQVSDMPTSRFYSRQLDRGIVSGLQVVLALDHRGEPKTMLEAAMQPGLTSSPYGPIVPVHPPAPYPRTTP